MSKYGKQPSEWIRKLIEVLDSLGKAVVVVRSPQSIASVNLVGQVYLGEDAGEPVLRVRGGDAHIHVMWDKITGYSIAEESAPGGNESVVWLVGEGANDPVIRIFFPDKSVQELEQALA